jgi:hypothetical protein
MDFEVADSLWLKCCHLILFQRYRELLQEKDINGEVEVMQMIAGSTEQYFVMFEGFHAGLSINAQDRWVWSARMRSSHLHV